MTYKKGVALPKIETQGGSFVVHAGTKLAEGSYQSNGGRVLLVGANGKSLESASTKVYQTLTPLEQTEGFFYRKDIGKN